MKKLMILALAILLTGLSYGQTNKKHLILSIASRASTMNNYVYPGDFVYIVADSTMYQSKVSLGPGATGTYLLASSARYNVALMNATGGAISSTTGTFSETLAVTGATTLSSTLAVAGNVGIGTTKVVITASNGNTAIAGTLGVTGATTLAGALNAAGACGFGASNNKVTIAAATGNTAIAGTLAVTGASTLTGATNVVGAFTVNTDKLTVAAASGNTAIAGTLGVTGNVAVNTDKFAVVAASGNTTVAGTLGVTGVATFTAKPVMSAGLKITATDTSDAGAVVGSIVLKGTTLYLCISASAARKWHAITATAN